MFLLVLDNPANDPNSSLARIVTIIDFWIVVVFNVEAFFRIVAVGFFTSSVPNQKAYIKQSSNVIDFFVLLSTNGLLIFNE
jgi:hypothetical protein